jgi:hypothetical protein
MKMMRNQKLGHIDFIGLQGAIKSNPRIMPSDIDFIIERKSKFLVAEWKRPEEALPIGQKILMKNLAEVYGFTVLLVIGHSDITTVVDKFYQIIMSDAILMGEGIDSFRAFINNWYDYADGNKR